MQSFKRKGTTKKRRFVIRRRVPTPRKYIAQHPNGQILSTQRMAADGFVTYTTAAGWVVFNQDTAAQAPWVNVLGSPGPDITGNSTAQEFGMGMAFHLTDVPNATDFTNPFNCYTIEKVTVSFTLAMGDSWNPGWSLPSMYIAPDYNDGAAPSSSGYMQNYDVCRYHQFHQDKPFHISFRPKVATTQYVSGVSSAYSILRGAVTQWVDCAAPSNGTPYYGLKVFFRNMPNVNALGFGIRIQPTYYMRFQQLR